MDAQRQLLAQLMNPLIPTKKRDFKDAKVCKNHLVAFCPGEIFLNTKVDAQRCNLIHDDELQKDYLALPEKDRIYDYKFYDYLSKMLADVERTIKRGYSRLENKSEVVFDNLDDIKEKIIILEEQIQPNIGDVCEYGEAGKVAEAMDYFFHLSKLTGELEVARQSDPSHPSYRPDKRMEVCHICGALLANDSTGARIDAHMIGKQHTGFIRIRKVIEEYNKRMAKSRAAREGNNQRNGDDMHRRSAGRQRDRGGGGRYR